MASQELSQLRTDIDGVLADFTKARSGALVDIGSELRPVAAAMTEFITDGGKRFRPIFAYLGYLGTGATPRQEILKACTALELVHVCALIHDDVMDGSYTRRNKPAIHKLFQALHDESSYQGNSERFGLASAILLGDLALVWADRLLVESGITREEFVNAQEVFSDMRDELMAGQYLDVLEGALARQVLRDRSKLLGSNLASTRLSGHFTLELRSQVRQSSMKPIPSLDFHLAKHFNFATTFWVYLATRK